MVHTHTGKMSSQTVMQHLILHMIVLDSLAMSGDKSLQCVREVECVLICLSVVCVCLHMSKRVCSIKTGICTSYFFTFLTVELYAFEFLYSMATQ